MEDPKILHIITGLEVGGAERSLLEVLTSSAGKPRSDVVVSLLGDGQYGPLIRDLGYRVELLRVSGTSRIPLAFSRLRRLIKTIRPDVIHAWMYHANIVASLVGKSLVGWKDPKLSGESAIR